MKHKNRRKKKLQHTQIDKKQTFQPKIYYPQDTKMIGDKLFLQKTSLRLWNLNTNII